ncbi:hypothetical protein RB653_000324 [Dictyostelium firmibasis]|uniref:Elongation factor Ts, mitochondrial n=1 Tax=Dictyostelium firmibasis TaxID=79012 RepID=A0AAN7UF74_9MYCE
MIRSLGFALKNCNKNILINSNKTINNGLLKNNFCTKSSEVKVPTELVVQLRKKTQSPVQECKKALQASNNDMEGAIKWLLEKGKATAEKLKTRVSAEGIVSVLVDSNNGKAVILEMNSETDFVSRGDIFRNLAREISGATLVNPVSGGKVADNGILEFEPSDIENIYTIKVKTTNEDGVSEEMPIKDAIVRIVSKLRENIVIRRASFIQPLNNNNSKSYISSYAHDSTSEKKDVGRLGSIVQLEYQGNCTNMDSLKQFANQLAIHIVSNSPSVVSTNDIPSSVLEECKNNNKKPESLYDDMVLYEQSYMYSPEHTVKQYLEILSEKIGTENLSVKTFRRYAIGETAERV